MNRMSYLLFGLGLRARVPGRLGHINLGCTDSRTGDSEIDSFNIYFEVWSLVAGAWLGIGATGSNSLGS
jgi:hypothetical protein